MATVIQARPRRTILPTVPRAPMASAIVSRDPLKSMARLPAYSLVRDNCSALNPPQTLDSSQISVSPDGQSLSYQDREYNNEGTPVSPCNFNELTKLSDISTVCPNAVLANHLTISGQPQAPMCYFFGGGGGGGGWVDFDCGLQ